MTDLGEVAAPILINTLISKTDVWLTKEWSLAEKIKTEVIKLRSELDLMRAFIKSMYGQGKQDSLIQEWIQQLRDIAYDIEVLLDMSEYQNARQNAGGSARTSRTESHRIDDLIQKIQSSLNNFNDMWRRYKVNVYSHPAASTSSDHELRIASVYMTPEVEIVGVEGPTEELVTWALDDKKTYKVMFVVGMGGSGKTALVKLVYERVKMDFDCHVWLTASMFEQGKELLSTMYNKLRNQTAPSLLNISSQTFEDLVNMLNKYLRDKRCLIVLDDLWNRNVWESVSCAFPRDNCSSSRIIITTRRGDIASSCRESSDGVYKVQPLPYEKAQDLFYRRAFPESGLYPSAPRDLFPSSEKLLNACEGLPLGIIKIGKLLSNREKSEFELKKLHDSLQAELISSGQLSSIAQVLLPSYNDLPDHLKCCFLYMSMFPAFYSVKRRVLIRLWIAEGFIEGVDGKMLEDIGEEYLKELMERNLIQASDMDFDGRPRTCRVHNLMHKIALSISEAESFCKIGGVKRRKARRLSIQNSEFNMPKEILDDAHTLFTSSIKNLNVSPGNIGESIKKMPQEIWHRAPTLFTSSIKNLNISPGNIGESIKKMPQEIGHRAPTLFTSSTPLDIPPSINISEMKLLKILHLDHANVDALPSAVEELYLLKYLSLCKTRIKKIPKTIGRLQLLETLNLKQTFVKKMPKNLGNLEKLRYLACSRDHFDEEQGGFDAREGISELTNLQKLSIVRADEKHKLIRNLRKLTQLRKLGIIDLPSDSGPFLCETIEKLTNLHSLSMRSQDKCEVLDIQAIGNPPTCLERLYLSGHLEKMPHWIPKLHDLRRIRLKWSRLTDEQNPITVLGELHNLLELQLLDAYTGDQLDFYAGTFPKLKIVEFERMEKLLKIEIENGALPCLQKLIIRNCPNLRRIPEGIRNVTRLKVLDLSDMPSDFVNPLRRNGELRDHVEHIGTICSRILRNDNQWEDEDLNEKGKEKAGII